MSPLCKTPKLSSIPQPKLFDMTLRSSAFEQNLFAMTLFTDDLEASSHFYGALFRLDDVFRDGACVIFKCGGTMINMLKSSEAAELIEAEVKLLSGPVDQPWGVRTLCVQDPSGHVWEFANH